MAQVAAAAAAALSRVKKVRPGCVICTPSTRVNRILVLGQLISVLISCTSILTQILNQNFQIQIAVTQSAGNYFLLCGYLIFPYMMYRNQQGFKLQIPLWKYFCLALADVEGNFVSVLAYQYTTISSAMLLDCFSIPVVMILSTLFLNAKYTKLHVLGVFFCLMGIGTLVLSDILHHKNGSIHHSWNFSALFGDLLCLLGSAVYACSNVAQEYIVKNNRRTEFLGMVGLNGFFISSVQAYFFEGQKLREIEWSLPSVLCLLGYILTLFVMYNFTSIFMKAGDAAIFNLSLLTSDFFAVVAAKYLFNETLSNLYYLGFFLIISGIILYNKSPHPTSEYALEEDKSNEPGVQMKLLDEDKKYSV